jgi:hypothetical protein
LATSETSLISLSLLLDQSHIVSRNPSLSRMYDDENAAQGPDDRGRMTPVILPGQDCIRGRAVLTVKGQTSVSSVSATVHSKEAIHMKLEMPSSAAGGASSPGNPNRGTRANTKQSYTSVSHLACTTPASLLLGPNTTNDLQPGSTLELPFSISLPSASPASFTYTREGASLSYEPRAKAAPTVALMFSHARTPPPCRYTLALLLKLAPGSSPLRPLLAGGPVVKFLVIKRGGCRVRASSRRNSKEVGWIGKGAVVYVDKKEWYSEKGPDPLRESQAGFWRVHVACVEAAGPEEPPSRGDARQNLRGWISGKSDVIEPVSPSTELEVKFPLVVTSAPLPVNTLDLSPGAPQYVAPPGFGLVPKQSKDTSKFRSQDCCFGVSGKGHVKIELGLDRTVFWKKDGGGGVGGGGGGGWGGGGAGVGGGEDPNPTMLSRPSIEGPGVGVTRNSVDGGGGVRGSGTFEGGFKARRPSMNELHATQPTLVLTGMIRVANSAKDEIPQCVLRYPKL